MNSLGNIGEAIPNGLTDNSFKGAKLQLNVFANAIFNDPSCKGLYTQDENKRQLRNKSLSGRLSMRKQPVSM
ncbi:MAG: hypothetical protein LBF34_02355 [Puniceicoccales bacterium]|nr:hypothetical protein [Puniceicoccales bacterium]